MKTKITVALFAVLAVLTLGACGNSTPSAPSYNNGWGTHYYNGVYDPFYNYGLGTYQQNGRTYYNTPSITPPAGVPTAKTPFKTTAPMPTNQPKPSSKPKVETAKPAKPKAPAKPSKPKK